MVEAALGQPGRRDDLVQRGGRGIPVALEDRRRGGQDGPPGARSSVGGRGGHGGDYKPTGRYVNAPDGQFGEEGWTAAVAEWLKDWTGDGSIGIAGAVRARSASDPRWGELAGARVPSGRRHTAVHGQRAWSVPDRRGRAGVRRLRRVVGTDDPRARPPCGRGGRVTAAAGARGCRSARRPRARWSWPLN